MGEFAYPSDTGGEYGTSTGTTQKGSAFSGANSMAAFIVPAAATVVGSAISSQGAKGAAAAQERVANNTLAFAKQQEATRLAQYNKAYDMWNTSRQALMSRYGLDVPGASAEPAASAPMTGAPAGMAAHPMPQVGAYGLPQQQGGGTVADLLSAVQGRGGPQMGASPDLGAVFSNRYGLA